MDSSDPPTPDHSSKLYKTLPGPLRHKEERKRSGDPHSHSPLFGLSLNLSFSSLISSGVNFFDNLRKKTPSSTPTPDHSSSSHSSYSLATSSVGEAIEMTAFPEPEGPGGSGAGHDWVEVATHNPTWCDLCGEMIWGLYSLGAWQCRLCSYTAHIKCRARVALDCSNHAKVEDVLEEVDEDDTDGQVASLCRDCPGASQASSFASFPSYRTARSDFSLPLLSITDSTALSETEDTEDQFQTLHDVRSISHSARDEFHTLRDVDTLTGEEETFHTLQDAPELAADPAPSLLALPPEELATCLAVYNSTLPPAQSCVWDAASSLYTGYIRVDMNLARPINVISGLRPPSTYSLVSDSAASTLNDRTLTTFYLPPGTQRALHITSQTTTQDVIRVLLRKFRVADNPHKYALYERHDQYRGDSFPRSKSLARLKLRRLQEEEKPLVLAVLWGREGGERRFVLQENDPGEIQWEQFTLPELKNFLIILDREEAWYKRRIHEKYETVQEELVRLLQEKREEQ